MNGATAEPSLKMMRPPKSKSIMIIGANQNFFRSRIKSHSSAKKPDIYHSSVKRLLKHDQQHEPPWAPDSFPPEDQIVTEVVVFLTTP